MGSASEGRSYDRSGGLVVIVSGWPRVSETFALNELRALRRAGLLTKVFATKVGDPSVVQPATREIDDIVEVLADGEPDQQADQIVERLSGVRVHAVHGYFAHRPAELAAEVAARLGVPYGFSVHALDARKAGSEALAERCRRAAVVVSCNDDVAASVRAIGIEPAVVRHGVSLDRFRCDIVGRHGPVSLLAVGRLVEKKGLSVLVEALTYLPASTRLRIVGDGPERERLASLVGTLGLGERVELFGRCTHADLPALYAEADIVVVPSIVDSTGDRDGLPNVVLEAMACGRAIVASRVAAIPSAITSGENGLLVPPGDARVLAWALYGLCGDPGERVRLGKAARADAERHHALEDRTDELCSLLVDRYRLPAPGGDRG